MSLARLATALREGELSPREAVERCLGRIEAVDPEVNSYIAVRADEALAEADALLRSDERGPLWGVPVALKDVIDVAGTPTTAASASSPTACPRKTPTSWRGFGRRGQSSSAS